MPQIRKRKRSKKYGGRSSKRSRLAGSRKRYRGSVRSKIPLKNDNPSTCIIRQPSGCPDRMYVKLKWSAILSATSTAGGAAEHSYNGNGPYSPGGSGQPFFWDQWGAMYYEHICVGSQITVRPVSEEGYDVYYGKWFVVPHNQSTAFSTQLQAINQPYAKHRDNRTISKISSYMGTDKMLGVKKGSCLVDNSFWGTTSSNASTQWYWHVGMFASNLTATLTQYAEVDITYYCVLFNRTNPGNS